MPPKSLPSKSCRLPGDAISGTSRSPWLLIGSFQLFDTIAVTTKGGPVNATRVVYFYIYEQAFTHFKMGYASALALSLVLILGVLTFIQLRLLRASTSDLT